MSKSIGEQNYEQFARRYAERTINKPHNAHYERPATLSLVPDVQGLSVLDAGCGPGHYAEWLLEHGAQVVGFDVTPDMIKISAERLGNRVELHVADLNEPLTFAADEAFDLVICPLVLDYIEDWGVPFREFHRVLKPGGILIFSCGHPAADFYVYFTEGIYFDVEYFETRWHGFGEPAPLIKAYRRPLMAMLNPLTKSGFVLDHILEPQPVKSFKAFDPQHYDELMRGPGFLCVRARKQETTS